MDFWDRLKAMRESSDAAERLVEKLWLDVTYRQGWRQAADQFDDDIKHSILDDWLAIVRSE